MNALRNCRFGVLGFALAMLLGCSGGDSPTDPSPLTPQPRAQIIRGTGTAELSDTVTVPASGVTSIQVFFPLVPAGSTSTSVVDSVTYSVR